MKSILLDLNKSGNKYWNAIQISVLVAIFSYFFAENFVLSDSWEVLSLRSIDDYAMQDSIRSMQKALISGDWKRVFSFFDYAYGNAFWLINAILLSPLYFVGDAQSLIVVGRQISLIFVFGSIYLAGLIIDRIRPDASQLKYPILIAIATMPMVTIIATKLHVNAQCVFLGLLSFYLLVREPILNRRTLIWSGVFAGMAVGFKLTGIFILPLLGLTLLNRLWQQGKVNIAKDTIIFCVTVILITAACTAPTLLLFPFFTKELGATYSTFLLFRNMANTEVFSASTLISDGIGFYVSPFVFAVIYILFLMLIFDDIKKNKYISTFIFSVIFVSMFFLVATVNKAPSYIATYLLSLSFFIPYGLLGITTIRASNLIKMLIIYTIIVSGLFYGSGYRNQILSLYRFFDMIKSEKVKNQLQALNEMKRLVNPLKLPVRILQDNTSIFPGTKFTDGIDVIYNYGNLSEHSAPNWGKFDYIVLNSKEYFGKVSPATDKPRELSKKELVINTMEEEIRQSLYNTGIFYGSKYRLIYEGYDSLLYKLESE